MEGIPLAGFRLPTSQSYTQSIQPNDLRVIAESAPPFTFSCPDFSDSEDEATNKEVDCGCENDSPLVKVKQDFDIYVDEFQNDDQDLDVHEDALDHDDRLEETEIAVRIDAEAENPLYENAASWLLYLDEHGSRVRYEAVSKLLIEFVAKHRLYNPESKVANIQLTIPFFADLNKQTVEVVDKTATIQEDEEVEERKEEEKRLWATNR